MTDREQWQPANAPATVSELIDRFLTHAETWYKTPPDRKGRRRATGHAQNFQSALRAAQTVIGHTPINQVTAHHLYAVRDWLLAQRKPNGDPLTRDYINRVIKMTKQMFRWGAEPEQDWVQAVVLAELGRVKPLVYGRVEARESEEVEPVPEAHVKSTLQALAELGQSKERALFALRLSVMIEMQWQTGMRPGELCSMNREEISVQRVPATLFEPEREIMVYQPEQHKTRHHKMKRFIFFGPEGRRLVEDWRPRCRRDGRFWKYTTGSYRNAIIRVNEQFSLPYWVPGQIRHSFATRMRSQAGLDVAQLLLGHKHASTTEIYAKPSTQQALIALLRFG